MHGLIVIDPPAQALGVFYLLPAYAISLLGHCLDKGSEGDLMPTTAAMVDHLHSPYF